MNTTKTRSAGMAATALALATAFALSMPGPARSAEARAASTQTQSMPQKSFAAPEQAFDALSDALKAGDRKTIATILGPRGAALLHSGDRVEDRQRNENFIAAYAEKHSVVRDGQGRATLVLGDAAWVMPIPAVEGAHGWTLDAAAGEREILARRIGQNELSAIEVARGIADAQREYASVSHDDRGTREYAARFSSSKGRRDGLYWETRAGEPSSPLGPFVARGNERRVRKTEPARPIRYDFRLLHAQGKDAPRGARSYAVTAG